MFVCTSALSRPNTPRDNALMSACCSFHSPAQVPGRVLRVPVGGDPSADHRVHVRRRAGPEPRQWGFRRGRYVTGPAKCRVSGPPVHGLVDAESQRSLDVGTVSVSGHHRLLLPAQCTIASAREVFHVFFRRARRLLRCFVLTAPLPAPQTILVQATAAPPTP
jgi:hypothetical protein